MGLVFDTPPSAASWSPNRPATIIRVDAAEAEFSWIFNEEFASIARTAYLIVHDRTTAEDVAQEAFTRLFVNWAKVSQYERPGAWVRRVAIRLAVRHARRDRMRVLLLRWVEPPRNESEASDPDLIRAIRALPPQQRAAVALHYFEDRPVVEIAVMLGCSPATAKVHLFKARKRLASLLTEPDEEGHHAS
jgi:RNA polymerase sigma-70 factor (ECF subfamily)